MDLLANLERNREVLFTRGLVLFLHGKALCLTWRADEEFSDWMHECGAASEPFSLESAGITYAGADGLFVGRFESENLGLSDWPDGSCEYGITFDVEREATQSEWERHLNDEWPWDFETFPARSGARMHICHRRVKTLNVTSRVWLVAEMNRRIYGGS